jgi:hypothetical protein
MDPSDGLDAVERKVSARSRAPIPRLFSPIPCHCSPFSDEGAVRDLFTLLIISLFFPVPAQMCIIPLLVLHLLFVYL